MGIESPLQCKKPATTKGLTLPETPEQHVLSNEEILVGSEVRTGSYFGILRDVFPELAMSEGTYYCADFLFDENGTSRDIDWYVVNASHQINRVHTRAMFCQNGTHINLYGKSVLMNLPEVG